MPDLPPVHRPAFADRLRKQNAVARAERNQAKRAYRTSHPVWRRMRAAVLQREPLCRECRKHGETTPATDVDHIDGNTFNNAMSNLQPLCKPCHTRKTVREQQGK